MMTNEKKPPICLTKEKSPHDYDKLFVWAKKYINMKEAQKTRLE